MKRVLILTVIMLLCFSISAFAAKVGLEGGLNYNNVKMSNDDANISASGSGMGFHIGGYYNYPLKSGDILKLGVGLTTRKLKIEASEGGYSYTMEPDMKSFDLCALYVKQSPKNPNLSFLAGVTIVKENDGTVKYTQEYMGVSDSFTDNVDSDDLETDFFITGGIKYKMQDNIYPEVKLQYNLTPDRDFYDTGTEFSSYFTILFSVAMEFDM